jgi:hypothetical protein
MRRIVRSWTGILDAWYQVWRRLRLGERLWSKDIVKDLVDSREISLDQGQRCVLQSSSKTGLGRCLRRSIDVEADMIGYVVVKDR